MTERRLAHVVGFAAALGHDGVGGTGQHDRGAEILVAQDARCFISQKIIGGDIHVERHSPLLIADLPVGRGGENGGGVDQYVEATIGGNQVAQALADRLAASNINGYSQAAFFSRDCLALPPATFSAASLSRSAITTCAPRSAASSAASRPMPLPPPTTSTTCRLNSFSGGWRRILASSSCQYSMRNASEGGNAT